MPQRNGRVISNLNYMQNEDVLQQFQSCEDCGEEMSEDGQHHFCSDCKEELTETQCKEWGALCERCAWLISK